MKKLTFKFNNNDVFDQFINYMSLLLFYQETLYDADGVPYANPQSKLDFVKEKILVCLWTKVQEYLVSTGQQEVVAEVETEVTGYRNTCEVEIV